MKTYKTTTVNGQTFIYFSDITTRATYAQRLGSMETRKIHGGGYITNELTVRKAIANTFGLGTFRK